MSVTTDQQERIDAGTACHEAALDYLGRGRSAVPVCPPDHVGMAQMLEHPKRCASPGKAPAIRWKQYQDNLPTEAELNAAWRQNPTMNVGIVCGAASRVVGIDVDGSSGAELLDKVSGGDLPTTLEFTTPSGGRRLLYAIPDGVAVCTTHQNGMGKHEGVSFLGQGGHTVMPPSRGREGVYEWVPGHSPDEIEAATMPQWLIDKLRKPENESGPDRNGEHREPFDDPPANAGKILERCAFLQHCRDDSETLSEPSWFAMTSIIARTDGGAELVHKFSEPYPNYNRTETDKKIKRCLEDATGPHKCETIATGVGAEHCKGCEWRFDITTPLDLGPSPKAKLLSNCKSVQVTDEKGKPKEVLVPLSMTELIESVSKQTGGWPRRVGNVLFSHDSHGISYFEKTPQTMGWLQSVVKVRWHDGAGRITKPEFTSELARSAQSYAAAESLPHFPPLAGHYYASEMPEPGDGSTLRKLLDRFRPDTTIDRDLIEAAIVTPFWGGPAGARPVFCFAADAGRGSGKTATATACSQVSGGFMSVSAKDEISKIVGRLLSPEGLAKRTLLLDNVKTMRFSWAEFESLITSPVISGHRMYAGEGSRPNTLTVFMTLNGPSLATDMAQRCVVVKVTTGENYADWLTETFQFIDDNGDRLIADVAAFFRRPVAKLTGLSRWAAWEGAVLSRLSEPGDALKVIAERQGESDAEADEAEIIEDYFAGRLRSLGYNPVCQAVRIPVAVVAEWFVKATRERMTVAASTRRMGQMNKEGRLQRIEPEPGRRHGRCFIWSGTGSLLKITIYNDLLDRIAERAAREDGKDTW